MQVKVRLRDGNERNLIIARKEKKNMSRGGVSVDVTVRVGVDHSASHTCPYLTHLAIIIITVNTSGTYMLRETAPRSHYTYLERKEIFH